LIGIRVPACPNPEERSDEVEFGHPPIKPGKFGKPEQGRNDRPEIPPPPLARLKNSTITTTQYDPRRLKNSITTI